MKQKSSNLGNRVVVITGASSGIGLETSLAFAHEGCRLVLAARRADALEKAVESCQALGAEAFAIPTDITRQDNVEQLVRETLSKWSRIDVWVNNAGTTMFCIWMKASSHCTGK